MAQLTKLETKKLPKLYLAGKEIRYSMAEQMQPGGNRLPGFWDKCFAENIFEPLEAGKDKLFAQARVGTMLDWQRGDGDFSYVVGVLLKTASHLPAGYVVHELAPCTVAVGYLEGDSVMDVCSCAHEKTEAALKEKGLTCESMTWCMEYYDNENEPETGAKTLLHYYIPCDDAGDK